MSAAPGPVVEEVLVSFKATKEATKLNGVYRRRDDLQAREESLFEPL